MGVREREEAYFSEASKLGGVLWRYGVMVTHERGLLCALTCIDIFGWEEGPIGVGGSVDEYLDHRPEKLHCLVSSLSNTSECDVKNLQRWM